MTKGEESCFASGSQAEELRLAAYNAAMREASRGESALRSVTGEPEGEPEAIDPTVLAISCAEGDATRYVVAQTVPEDDGPRLHLLATGGDPRNFRIVWEGDMLPGTEVGLFDRRSVGSPVLLEEEGELYFEPANVMRNLGRLLDYPLMDTVPNLRTNGYAPEVRQVAQEQAGSVFEQASFRQTHAVRENALNTIELADGSALTFAVLDRRSTFQVRDGMELSPPDTFRSLASDTSITDQARVDSVVFAVMHIGTDVSPPRLIAVDEQIVGAQGS